MSVRQMTPTELAERLLLLSALEKRVAAMKAETQAELKATVPPGTTLKPSLGPGEQLGTVSFTLSNLRASVADMDAWAAWAEKNYPQNVSMVLVVADWLTEKALALSTKAGRPVGPGGELDPPGITLRPTAPYVSARPKPEAMPALWAQIRDRLPELTEAGE